MDCTANCRLAFHADVLLSVLTRENLEDVQSFVKYFCGNGRRARDEYGRNALHIAASCGRKNVLKWFLEEDVLNISEKDFESGWTALHRACYYGHLSCVLLLLQYGANIFEKDCEGLSPLELLILDSPCSSNNSSQDVDVYSWGRNANFTLAHGDDKERNCPEIIDVFARMSQIAVKEVILCKFHAVFLANDGSVWTCGHGLGGRLGHGDEKTILIPKKVNGLAGEVCTGVAAGQDHTVVLCENGNVFSFGENKYHQLGHQPPVTQHLKPKLILTKALKGKRFIGVAAGKFHTLMYTEMEVYSWGLNAGQLGHIKGEKTQITPRQISAVHLKDDAISCVTCCDAATVILTSHGDVFLIYKYTQRKIISKFPNILKLVVSGGHLDNSPLNEIKEKKFGPLTIYGVYGDGFVFQWQENDKTLRECLWSLDKPLSVRDLACGRSLHIVTAHGEVYAEDGTSASVQKPIKISTQKHKNVIKVNSALKQDEILEVSLIRVQHAHRAVRIIADKYSQNFAILQAKPSVGCTIVACVSSPEINNDMKTLLEEAKDSYDMEIKVKDKSIYVHQVILAQGSEKLHSLINEARQKNEVMPVLHLDDEDFDIMNEIVQFLYTGSCESLMNIVGVSIEQENQLSEDDMLNELALSLQDVDFDLLDLPQYHNDHQLKQGKKSQKQNENQDTMKSSKKSVKEGLQRQELARAAKKFKISDLISCLQDSSTITRVPRRCFHRSKLFEYCDVVIEAEDGVELFCHKCILVSRLEYFSIMLTTGWIESSSDFTRLKMPIPSRVLKVVIEFLYTDDAPSVRESKDLEFLGKVLTVADQLWIIRLREMCEKTLASMITLKNVVEMLEFSCLYNAENLKKVCLEFTCLNLPSLLEARSLDLLSEEIVDQVSRTYRQMIPRMSWRVITPNDVHLSIPVPQPESPSKRKSSRSQRRSRTSESDVTEDRAVLENGTCIREPTEEKLALNQTLPAEVMNKDDDVCPDSSLSSTKDKDFESGLWYQKQPNGCCREYRCSFKKEMKRSNSVPVPSEKNGDREEKPPWGNSSFSPQSSNLRSIMEQEESAKKVELGKSRKDGRSPGKSRLSQKERKRMQQSAEGREVHKSNSAQEETNDTSAIVINPWNNSPSRPSVSFRELLEEEQGLGTSVPQIKMKSRKVDISPVSGDKNDATFRAWQHNNVACSPPDDSCLKFNHIQEEQKEEIANRERNMKKPLSLIQIEDKAIEQLLEHYGGKYNPCEFIVVERETRNAGSPDWVK